MIHELFVELQKKFDLTFLVVTHNKELVALGNYVLEMKDGQIFNR
jgi:lipoprotein-releasing system ATP-binding protein